MSYGNHVLYLQKADHLAKFIPCGDINCLHLGYNIPYAYACRRAACHTNGEY